MEAINERAGKPSSNRRRPQREHSRKSFAESPRSQASKATRKKRKRGRESRFEEISPEEDIEYPVKDIVDERIRHGKKEYLIEWADSETGESFQPTWEPSDLVNEGALEGWNKKQAERRLTEKTLSQESLPQPSSSFDPDSQPIRTAKRQRANPSPFRTPSQPISKNPRRAGTAETARFQSALQKTVDSEPSAQEIKDSYEDQSLSDRSERIQVEITVDEGFPRDAYATVLSSQPSQESRNSQISRLFQPSFISSPTQFQIPTKPYVWDEDSDAADSNTILRDSQSIPGSSSYLPSQTQASIAVTSQVDASDSDLDSLSSQVDGGKQPCFLHLNHFGYRSQSNYISQSSGALGESPEICESPIDPGSPSSIHRPTFSLIPLSLGYASQETSPFHGQGELRQISQSGSNKSSNQSNTQVSQDPTISEDNINHVSTSYTQESVRSETPLFARSLLSNQVSLPAQFQSHRNSTSSDKVEFDDSGGLNESIATKSHSFALNGSLPKVTHESREGRFKYSEISADLFPSIRPYTFSSPSSRLPPPPLSTILPTDSSLEPATTFDMADKPMVELTTAQKLRRAREAAAESKMAEQRAERTPSTIPHTPPLDPSSISQMLPLREPTLDATVMLTTEMVSSQSHQNPKGASVVNDSGLSNLEQQSSSKEEEEDAEELSKGVQILPLGANVFAIPLPMVALARDIYDQEITNNSLQRRGFLDDDKRDRDLVADIMAMIDRLKMICDHQDLIDSSASQANEPDHRQAKWAENISTKCMFLAELFNSLQSSHTHVVLLVRQGRMMDILEAVFRIHDYKYSVPHRSFSHCGKGNMKISLLPTNVDPAEFSVDPASLVIAFDSTFRKETWVESLRIDPMNVRPPTPLAYLVVTHSIEHLELCLTTEMNSLERMGVLISWLTQTREEIGKLESRSDAIYASPDTTAKSLASFIVEGTGEWPLLPMPIIEEIELPVMISGISDEAELSGSTTQSYDLGSSLLHSTLKRSLPHEDNLDSFKRQRVSPDALNSGVSVSRINETMAGVDKPDAEGIGNLSMKADDKEEDQVSELLRKVTKLELQLQEKKDTEVELRQINEGLDARCKDYEKSIARIQPKYQEALNDRGQAAHDIQESMARETSMRRKFEERKVDLDKLQAQKILMGAELTAAQAALSSSSIPEISELQKVRDELAAAYLEVEKCKKKISNVQNDSEFMRTNYQQASNAAAALRNELDELKSQNEVLAKKASDNSVEIHRIQSRSETKQYLQMITNLEVERAAFERELEKKSEELRSLQNGRRATRGTSVPRSPRMGTMSPGQTSRPMARVLGVGSRGNSPAPGGEIGFRGPGTFGDALFPASGPLNRWANHLS